MNSVLIWWYSQCNDGVGKLVGRCTLWRGRSQPMAVFWQKVTPWLSRETIYWWYHFLLHSWYCLMRVCLFHSVSYWEWFWCCLTLTGWKSVTASTSAYYLYYTARPDCLTNWVNWEKIVVYFYFIPDTLYINIKTEHL